MENKKKVSSWQLFLTFLKIGSVAFGGFMSLIAVVENVIVKDKKWLDQETIVDGITLASLLPGPMAVNVVTYVGYKIKGISGAIASFLGIILPSFLMILVLGDLYFRYSDSLIIEAVFKGIMIAVAAIIFQVTHRMSKKNLKSQKAYLLAFLSFIILLIAPKNIQLYTTFGVIIILGILGYVGFLGETKEDINTKKVQKPSFKKTGIPLLVLGSWLLISLLPLPFNIGSLEHLFVTFGGLGLMLFGGGYVFIPMIQELVVGQYHWMTQQTFIDAIALGQVTPGPIVISITFIAYQVKGILGAVVATLAIFGTPATLMVVMSQLMDYFKQSPRIQQVIKTIRCGVIGMIFYAGFTILLTAFPSEILLDYVLLTKTVGIFLFCIFALFRFKISVLWLIPLAGLLGYLFF